MKDIGKLPVDIGKIEAKWRDNWDKKKVFKFDPKSKKPLFSIDTPPPTISGKMHIGHAFSYTQMDLLARYHRMSGKELFYPFGTDDNGLPTGIFVEKENKVNSRNMSRDKFTKLCLSTIKKLRPSFIQDWKDIGLSADFDMFYSTIDDHSRRLSQGSFIDLYEMGRVYKKNSPIIFCPKCKTVIAQVEMEDEEKKSTLNYIKAKLETGEYMIYATTRPELHPACVGISIKKDGIYATVKRDNGELWVISKDAVDKMKDEFPMKVIKTYKGDKLIGKKVEIAFAENTVEVSHDISAKTEYGTGIVYYCSYGGLDCVEWLARHRDVEPVDIMNESGVYTIGPYKGMNSENARKKVLEDLEKKNLLVKKEKIKHAVNVHERCGADIEYIATEQWFIKYLDVKKKLLDAGKKIDWHPKHMRVRYDNWIKGLQWDWTISRQRYFGVPFPVWYCEDCNEIIIAKKKDLPVDPIKDKAPVKSCPKCKGTNFIPEEDTFDTWATSSLTPQLAIELVKDPKVRKKLFPMDLRAQAHDIITFWLFNTVVKSLYHTKKIPWKNAAISGHLLDPHGRKMSKSKGNVIIPKEVLTKFSADSLRYFASTTKLGEDAPFQEKELIRGKKLVSKLWNTARFVFMNLEDIPSKKPAKLELEDQWILSRLATVQAKYKEHFNGYRAKYARHEVEMFFLHEFCDYYLEMIKSRTYGENTKNKYAASWTSYNVFYSVLQMLSPIICFMTEELYQNLYKSAKKKESIHITEFENISKKNADSEKLGNLAKEFIAGIRQWKQKNKIRLGEEVDHLTVTHSNPNAKKVLDVVGRTMRISRIDYKKGKFHISQ